MRKVCFMAGSLYIPLIIMFFLVGIASVGSRSFT
jgi:hypothetical protein